ncbi:MULTISPECIES: type VI secretion system Vgr family protein [Pseudomonas]|uniref:Type VI secretion system tip protein VgrG n=1 Tax=Pseudomonas frederiksbergensis TaxID=104087 RepID=A0A2S8HJA5_9PSED|nr:MULTISPECIES: type VI secretion system tip protein TssI/VgrG [Pseudomonas]PQP02590.1 type VI secretion system tip protein VgrG [Pseudomonas frederiksbergensis]WLG52842.1 type VI secretion system tip protein TssI/VgrG [Pseudomonas sp. FP1742]
MHNDKESPYTLTLLDGDLSLQVLQFSGREGLNQPYRFDIEVIGLAPAMNLDQWLQQPAFLRLSPHQGIHGVIHGVSREHRGPHRVGYSLVLVPHLQRLDGPGSRRVFHRLGVPAIVRQLLEEHQLPEHSYRFDLTSGHYPLRPFCIQYDESDLAFMQRLCEEEGIHYHFEHQHDGHVLVLADDSLSFPQEPLLMSFHADAFNDPVLPVISELFQRHDPAPAPAQWDARNRGTHVIGDGAANHPLAGTGPVTIRPAPEQLHRDQLGRRLLERLRCQHRQIHGRSNQSELRSGRIVQVAEHPLSGFNDQWLLTDIRHQGQQPSILAENKPGIAQRYSNQFSAIPWSTVFRPALKQARPSIPGYQTARVLGPVGQPAVLDEQGRIQVRLWPTPTVEADESIGLWLPVALAAPDGRIDPSRLPMAGTEVLVSFLDSDPDRPVLCAGMGHLQPSRPAPEPRRDTRLLLDWLINRSDLTP